MPLKFAIVREDPEIEAALIERLQARSVLLVASGGCTALTLADRFPRCSITAFDINPAQLAHLRQKAAADAAQLEALNQSGEFEALFRVLRKLVEEFVAPPGEITAYFKSRPELAHEWVRARYWPAVFASAFNDPILNAMFGPDATQHAEPGSYPAYFQRAFERGLLRDDGPENPFLQHVFLGRFLRPPAYAGKNPPIDIIEGSLQEVASLERFDVLSLSNLFDWSSDALVADWGARIAREAHRGAAVLIRQLNNRRDVTRFFPGFRFEDAPGAERDRSLFYERIIAGIKT
jgi:S-adenosylmethionine:diacylglycerol 3-amino-3-carboxypropyl transferase